MLGHDTFEPPTPGHLQEREPLPHHVLAEADPLVGTQDLGEARLPVVEWLVEERGAVDVQEVEHLVHELAAGGLAQARLEQREVRLAVTVEADDLAVEDRRLRAEPRRWGEERTEVARGVLPATRPHRHAVAVDYRLHAEAVPLDLVEPVRVVEAGRPQRGQHGVDEVGQRIRCASARAWAHAWKASSASRSRSTARASAAPSASYGSSTIAPVPELHARRRALDQHRADRERVLRGEDPRPVRLGQEARPAGVHQQDGVPVRQEADRRGRVGIGQRRVRAGRASSRPASSWCRSASAARRRA